MAIARPRHAERPVRDDGLVEVMGAGPVHEKRRGHAREQKARGDRRVRVVPQQEKGAKVGGDVQHGQHASPAGRQRVREVVADALAARDALGLKNVGRGHFCFGPWKKKKKS
ncbi:MAG: hypothetical protein CL454_00690 [Acidimicrobiaceae bacterium]|nr:hypothetical protein [Acidimicrobiaceae bacterium]